MNLIPIFREWQSFSYSQNRFMLKQFLFLSECFITKAIILISDYFLQLFIDLESKINYNSSSLS